MDEEKPPKPVIVPLKELANLFSKAESALSTAAEQSPGGAAQLAAMGILMRKIQSVPESEADSVVMTTQQHAAISRLQSLIASGEAGDLKLEEAPSGGLEAKFDTGDLGGWASVAWARIANPINKPMIPPLATPEALPEVGRIALLGDWGTGLYGATVIADTLRNDPESFAMMVHLGDVYYSGTKKETQTRFLDLWPNRSEAIHRACNSNHEMYSGGEGLWELTLPAFKQHSTCFAHQNEHFLLIGIDVAYRDHAIDDAQVLWLHSLLQQAGNRRIILFSHHQLFSQYDSMGTKLWSHPGFRSFLQSGKILAWYWGHEHRCCIFDPHAETGILCRCLGHGGMPQSRKPTWNLAAAAQPLHTNWADWRTAAAQHRNGMSVPACFILEGPNKYIPGEEDKFLPHGYMTLRLDGPRAWEMAHEPDGRIIYESEITA